MFLNDLGTLKMVPKLAPSWLTTVKVIDFVFSWDRPFHELPYNLAPAYSEINLI